MKKSDVHKLKKGTTVLFYTFKDGTPTVKKGRISRLPVGWSNPEAFEIVYKKRKNGASMWAVQFTDKIELSTLEGFLKLRAMCVKDQRQIIERMEKELKEAKKQLLNIESMKKP